jgi:nanoRNase/pAp phosphatase (c-di-AMP/oligoRNAs hydrolase)
MEVLPRVDHRLLGQLRHPRVERPFFATLVRALQAARLCHDVVICHIDPVNAPDEVAQVADTLNSLEDCTWVLCSGRHGDSITLSLRTSDPSANASRVLDRSVGGRDSAGGHGMFAGGKLQLGPGEEPDAILDEITARLLGALGHAEHHADEPLLPPED